MSDLQRARSAASAKRRSGKGSVSATVSSVRHLRCAVYTRKSSEEGLDQDFNSLQVQREACEAYIASQRHEGWRLIATAYDDGGYSGGSMERPGLVQLLADVQSRRIDVVVVYKVDRLTRALADFAKIVEIFDAAGASFVSVTQSFNTTTSMGRLTLNVLLSFAQFEREVTAERIRDKIAASKRKGMWMGGPVPLGYRVEHRKLIVDEREAETVRLIFALYLEMRSTIATARELKQRGILTRKRIRSDGTVIGGIPFTRGPLQALLRNRVYTGDIIHKDQHHAGEHQPILSCESFEAVQQLLTEQRVVRSGYRHRKAALLTGRIFDSLGNRMTPSHANKHGVRYRYYVSRALLDGEKDRAGHPARIPAVEVEGIVASALRSRAEDHHHPVPDSDDMTLVESMLDSVQVHADHIVLTRWREQKRQVMTSPNRMMNMPP
jgi:site-specific DNA recombinase